VTVAAFGQSAFNFTTSTDPLFASVLTQPANLSNTIQYAVTAASHGDIESAISAYEQLRFYNPKLAATRNPDRRNFRRFGDRLRRAAI
jgi:hypothetical protein